VQDLLVRLDATIGRLLDRLDAAFGREGYIVGFSADHGVSEIPEQTGNGGRLTNDDIKAILQGVLVPVLGPGNHVVATHYTDHYLSPVAAERVRTDEQVRTALLDALRASPGIEQAYYGPDLAGPEARQSPDPLIRAAALSHYPGRSGDVILIPRRNWITSTSAATHGTLHEYDSRVPVIVYGRGVKGGVYDAEASPADLAPTLAAAAGIELAEVDGRVLSEAVAMPRR
jgi:arylsulfatase A-like enzyme